MRLRDHPEKKPALPRFPLRVWTLSVSDPAW